MNLCKEISKGYFKKKSKGYLIKKLYRFFCVFFI